MGNTLVTFRRKYYEYGVDNDPMNRSLAIEGYDSASDLIASYLLDLAQKHFTEKKSLIYIETVATSSSMKISQSNESSLGAIPSKPK